MLAYLIFAAALILGAATLVIVRRAAGARAKQVRSGAAGPDVFLSYSHREATAARTIADALRDRGVAILEDATLHAGSDYSDPVRRQLDASGAVLVVVGSEGLSQWQQREVDYALERKGGGLVLIAALLPGATPPSQLASSVQMVDLRSGFDANAFDLLARSLHGAPEPPPSVGAGDAPASPRADDVRFTVYRPAAVPPARWCEMLVFAHRTELPPDAPPGTPTAADRVREEAERLLGARARGYARIAEDSAAPVVRATQLVFVPEVDGVEFNPPRAPIDWLDDVHSVLFRLRADEALEGLTARGRLAIYGGPLLLAEMALVIPVSASAAEAATRADVHGSVAPYRRVFASYSHQDEAIVRQVEGYARMFGDDYLRDVTALRVGEHWDERIERLIEDADVFQLFWSWNALKSDYVRREWRHALALGRAHFVRPVYWEDPLPAVPEQDLPPADLRALHFQRLPFETTPTHAAAPGFTPAPARPSSAPRRPRPLFAAPLGAAAMVMLAIAGVAIVNRTAEPPPPAVSAEQGDPPVVPRPDPRTSETSRPPPNVSTIAPPPVAAGPGPIAGGLVVARLVVPSADAELRSVAQQLSEELAAGAPVLAPVVDSITLAAALSAARREDVRRLLTGELARLNGDVVVHVRVVDAETARTVLAEDYRTSATADLEELAARIRADIALVR